MADQDKPYTGGPGGPVSRVLGKIVYGNKMEKLYKQERADKERFISDGRGQNKQGRQPLPRGETNR